MKINCPLSTVFQNPHIFSLIEGSKLSHDKQVCGPTLDSTDYSDNAVCDLMGDKIHTWDLCVCVCVCVCVCGTGV
jgi:hypothetical protein